MFAKTNRSHRALRGFTLIELLVVVLILSILMAVALPLYLNAVSDSQLKTCRANMQTIANAEQAYNVRVAPHAYTDVLANLTDLQATPICPNGGTYSVALAENGVGTFTVHCNAVGHDLPGKGVKGGFTPGLDAQ